MLAELDEILRKAHEVKASDVHILVGMPPMVRRFGEIRALPDYEPLSEKDTREMLTDVLDVLERRAC